MHNVVVLGASGDVGRDDVVAGLRLTGHFLERNVFAHAVKHGAAEARARLVERLAARK